MVAPSWIQDQVHVAGIYIASTKTGLRNQLDRELSELLEVERSVSFDAAGNDADFTTLQTLERKPKNRTGDGK